MKNKFPFRMYFYYKGLPLGIQRLILISIIILTIIIGSILLSDEYSVDLDEFIGAYFIVGPLLSLFITAVGLWIHEGFNLDKKKDQNEKEDINNKHISNEIRTASPLKRLIAFMIDLPIIALFIYVPLFILDSNISQDLALDWRFLLQVIFFSIVIGQPLSWPYYAFFESSKFQGTLGKIVMSIKVVDLDGNPISFKKATIRHFSRLFANFTMGLMYLFILFDKDHVSFHDTESGCLVIYK